MPSLRHIRGRLRSIHNTKQIMRAMQLVSASKLKRSQDKLFQARAVVEFLDGLIERVLAAAPKLFHPLCAQREGGPTAPPQLPSGRHPERSRGTALVLFTSDAGLCGSYNANLIQLAESYLRRDSAKQTQLITIGKKGYRYFTKRGYAALASYLDLAGRPNLAKAEAIARTLMEHFLTGKVSAVQLLYSQFVSPMVYRPTIQPWLPIPFSNQQSATSSQQPPQGEYIFEPSPQRVVEDLMPRWALAKFQAVMLEAFTAEHSARMIAMKNATDNAEELLDQLTLQRNNIRQATITKELSEIIGTAEALR